MQYPNYPLLKQDISLNKIQNHQTYNTVPLQRSILVRFTLHKSHKVLPLVIFFSNVLIQDENPKYVTTPTF